MRVKKNPGNLSEKNIENHVLSWLKFHQIFAFKLKSMGTYDPTTKRFRSPSPWYRKGAPDIVAVVKGQFIGLEIKSKKGSLSIHQKLFHQDLVKAGGVVYVVRDVSELDKIFKPVITLKDAV